MRSVTRKPPTTLIVPKAIAITRITLLNALLPAKPITSRPPSTTMPWIALVPLISGVCSVLGTFEITAKPTKPASTRIVRFVISIRRSPPLRRAARADDLAVAGHARPGDDLVVPVERELAVRC